MTDRELRDLIYSLERVLDILERTAPHIATRVAGDINCIADWAAGQLYETGEYRRWGDAP